MENILTTQELCQTLDISRNWINNHLRQLSTVKMTKSNDVLIKKVVVYEIDELLRWFNKNAKFTRQTHWLNLLDYAKEQEIENVYKKMDELPDTVEGVRKRIKLLRSFLEQILPKETFDAFAAYDAINVRKRRFLPWVEASVTITDLEQLHTIKKRRGNKNNEIAYRDIFNKGMIRVEVDGRKWYMHDNEDSFEYKILMPADVK